MVVWGVVWVNFTNLPLRHSAELLKIFHSIDTCNSVQMAHFVIIKLIATDPYAQHHNFAVLAGG